MYCLTASETQISKCFVKFGVLEMQSIPSGFTPKFKKFQKV